MQVHRGIYEIKLCPQRLFRRYVKSFMQEGNRFTVCSRRCKVKWIRFKILADQKIVSEPILEEGPLGVTTQGKRLFVDDRVYKITIQSDWEDPSRWKMKK